MTGEVFAQIVLDARLQASHRALAWVLANYDWALKDAPDTKEALEALIHEALTIDRMTAEDTK